MEWVIFILIICLVFAALAAFGRKKSLEEAQQARRQTQRKEAQEIIDGISQSGKLPVVENPPIMLREAEFATLMAQSQLMEERAVRRGGYGGIRIARGVWIGGSQSESHGELRTIDSGLLILTNQRLVFIGAMRTSEIPLKKIINVTQGEDALLVNTTARQKAQLFTLPNPHIWAWIIRTLTESPTSSPIVAGIDAPETKPAKDSEIAKELQAIQGDLNEAQKGLEKSLSALQTVAGGNHLPESILKTMKMSQEVIDKVRVHANQSLTPNELQALQQELADALKALEDSMMKGLQTITGPNRSTEGFLKVLNTIPQVLDMFLPGVEESSRRQLYDQMLRDKESFSENPEQSYVVGLLAARLGEFESAASLMMEAARGIQNTTDALRNALNKAQIDWGWEEDDLEVATFKLSYDINSLRKAVALIYYKMDKYDLMVPLLSGAEGCGDTVAAGLLGCSYFHQDKFDMASNMFYPLIDIPGDGGILFTLYLARCLCKLKQHQAAVDLLRRKLVEWDGTVSKDSKTKGRIKLAYYLGEALYQLGDKNSARDQFKQVYLADKAYKDITKYADELFPQDKV